jgi:S1-C subfamily serine protease
LAQAQTNLDNYNFPEFVQSVARVHDDPETISGDAFVGFGVTGMPTHDVFGHPIGFVDWKQQ